MRKFVLSAAIISCGAAAIPVVGAKMQEPVVNTRASGEQQSREHARPMPKRDEAPHSARAASREKEEKHVQKPRHEKEEGRDDD